MMKSPSSRVTYSISFVTISVLLGIAAYLQSHNGLNPCPLCILQRLTLATLGVIFFFGAALNLKRAGRIIIGILACLISCLGAFLAGRQVWLQHLPSSQNIDCGVSLQYMLQALPLNEVFEKVFVGSAECSTVGGQFLNLSLAEWSLVCFMVFLGISAWQLCRIK